MVRYGSFVVRLWRRGGEPRVVVEHIQSGAVITDIGFTRHTCVIEGRLYRVFHYSVR